MMYPQTHGLQYENYMQNGLILDDLGAPQF